MKQVRVSAEEVLGAVINLVVGTEVWADVFRRLPEFVGQSDNEYLHRPYKSNNPSNAVTQALRDSPSHDLLLVYSGK
jgi:hypothetical protein